MCRTLFLGYDFRRVVCIVTMGCYQSFRSECVEGWGKIIILTIGLRGSEKRWSDWVPRKCYEEWVHFHTNSHSARGVLICNEWKLNGEFHLMSRRCWHSRKKNLKKNIFFSIFSTTAIYGKLTPIGIVRGVCWLVWWKNCTWVFHLTCGRCLEGRKKF